MRDKPGRRTWVSSTRRATGFCGSCTTMGGAEKLDRRWLGCDLSRWAHDKKGRAIVHVGVVDAPVTIDEINQAIEDYSSLNQAELRVLGWEWEMCLAQPWR